MITLIHAPRSRSSSTLWLMEEAGAPYRVRRVDIRRMDGSGRLDPVNPHPHGKVPALLDGDAIIFEQSAIALYVADRFPQAKLGPKVGEPGRGLFVTMLAYYSGVVEPAVTSKFLGQPVPRGSAGWVDLTEVTAFLNGALTSRPFIAGDAFTSADILYAGLFAYFLDTPFMADLERGAINAYVARCHERPARARAVARDEAGD